METVVCNLCHSAKSNPYFMLPDLLLERPEVISRLVRCNQCGLIYQNPRPTLDEIGVHYPNEYDSFNPETGENESGLMRQAVQYGLRKRFRFVSRHRSGGRLLDIGCATGLFLNEVARHPAWEAFGVEINETAAQRARDGFGLSVFTGTLEQAAYPGEYFDAVTLWDVFEHLHDPKGTLDEIGRILKPDGLLVIRVPNNRSWDSQIFRKAWAGLDQPRHLYVFDPLTMKEILSRAGFKVVQGSSRIGSYPTFVLSVRFWLVMRETAPRRRERIIRLLYHPLSRIVTSPFFYLASMGSRGPLWIVTAEKEAAPVA
jgi:SAM-dependent methyltransferase